MSNGYGNKLLGNNEYAKSYGIYYDETKMMIYETKHEDLGCERCRRDQYPSPHNAFQGVCANIRSCRFLWK